MHPLYEHMLTLVGLRENGVKLEGIIRAPHVT